MAIEANMGGLERISDLQNRVGRLEGAYEHLAAKVDLQRLRADLTWRLFVGMSIWMGLLIAYIEWRVVP